MLKPYRYNSGIRWNQPGVTWNGMYDDNTNMNDNRISATLAAAAITNILAAIQTIRTNLPFLIEIGEQERMELPKLGEKTVGFDEKSAAYMASNPEFLPAFILIAEVNKDRALRTAMLQFFPQLKQLFDQVSDTMMVLGSELYMADLGYYQSSKEAARRGRPGAETIYNDLQSRFPGAPKKAATPPTP